MECIQPYINNEEIIIYIYTLAGYDYSIWQEHIDSYYFKSEWASLTELPPPPHWNSTQTDY